MNFIYLEIRRPADVCSQKKKIFGPSATRLWRSRISFCFSFEWPKCVRRAVFIPHLVCLCACCFCSPSCLARGGCYDDKETISVPHQQGGWGQSHCPLLTLLVCHCSHDDIWPYIKIHLLGDWTYMDEVGWLAARVTWPQNCLDSSAAWNNIFFCWSRFFIFNLKKKCRTPVSIFRP